MLCGDGESNCCVTYLALQGADEELVESLAGLVGVANILESLSGVLTSNIKDDLLTTTIRSHDQHNGRWWCVVAPTAGLRRLESGGNSRVLVNELGAVVDLVVDYEEAVFLGVVLSNILESELLGGRHFLLRGSIGVEKKVIRG